jgi:antitoxin YobK
MDDESLRTRLKTAPSIRVGKPGDVDPAWIIEAERELGLPLPPSYRWWLVHIGWAFLGSDPIYTLAPPEFRDEADSDLLYAWRLSRQRGIEYAQRLYFHEPNGDESFYFDLSRCGADGEYPVMIDDLVAGECRDYAENFARFFEMEIRSRTKTP